MIRVSLSREERDSLTHDRTKDANEYLEVMLRRFKKQVIASGVLEECKKREFFLKKSLARKEKSKKARIRLIKSNKIKGRRAK